MAKTTSFIPVHSRLARELVRSSCMTHDALSARAYIPSRPRFRSSVEVSTPMDHGLPYEDLTLDTSDGVRIKAYLLLQRRYLPGDHANGKPLVSEEDVAEADRKVWMLLNASCQPYLHESGTLSIIDPTNYHDIHSRSLPAHVLQSSCSMVTGETLAIECLLPGYFIPRFGAMSSCYHTEGRWLLLVLRSIVGRKTNRYGLSDGQPSEAGAYEW
jgi:hypothetical protein